MAVKQRKGWAPLSSFSPRYIGPHGEVYEVRSYEDIDAHEKAWTEYLEGPGSYKPEPTSEVERVGQNIPADPIRKAREAEALAYVRDYSGRWGLPLDIRADRRWGTKHMRLSDRQIEVLLEGKARDLARAKERKQTGRDLHVLPIGRTYAAVDNEQGSVTFLIFDRPDELDRNKQPNKWHGWVFVKQFIGGIGDGQRLGSQRPGESYSGAWPALIDKVIADPMAAVQRFGRELGICGVCNLPLTNDESREFGIGPVCRAKIGGGD